jgi:uncharacterized phage protein (TIGR01671 family)
MTDLKFRAWDKHDEYMEYIEDLWWFEESGVHSCDGCGRYHDFVLMQSVGQKDIHQKDIYEGDIVKTKYGRLCVVEQLVTPSYCGWDLSVIDTRENISLRKPDEWDLWSNLEVVGNIYDNPEMLKS